MLDSAHRHGHRYDAAVDSANDARPAVRGRFLRAAARLLDDSGKTTVALLKINDHQFNAI